MVPGITHIFVQKYMEQCLKIYIKKARNYRYTIIYSIDAHKKQQPLYVDDGSIGGVNEIPSNYTTEALNSLGELLISFLDG